MDPLGQNCFFCFLIVCFAGDAVIVPSSSSITVSVEPSDNPLGVFLFDIDSTELFAEEGENVSLMYVALSLWGDNDFSVSQMLVLVLPPIES